MTTKLTTWVLFLLITPRLGYMMEQKSQLRSIEDIPQHCFILASMLQDQPVQGKKLKRKLLLCKDFIDCAMCSLISQLASHFVKYSWPINTCSDLNNGLELTLFERQTSPDQEPPTPIMCSLEQLKEAYTKVIGKIQCGWAPAIPDPKEFLVPSSKDEWSLFIKKNAFKFEDNFIGYLASRFGLSEMIYCHNISIEDGCHTSSDTISLWIRKKDFERVQSIFKLQIQVTC